MRPLSLLAALALAACSPADAPADAAPARAADTPAADHAQMDHGPAAGTAPADPDLAFLDRMTAHHQAALDMAALAPSRAGSAAVRALAAEIAAAQRAEIDTMAAWRARWFPDAPPPPPMTAADHSQMGMAEMDLDALRAARGRAFDRLFMEQMVPHHAAAVEMAAETGGRTARPELRRLAAAIVEAQEREIAEMRTRLDVSAATDSAAAR